MRRLTSQIQGLEPPKPSKTVLSQDVARRCRKALLSFNMSSFDLVLVILATTVVAQIDAKVGTLPSWLR